MKSSTKDKIKGTFHQVKGAVKEAAGKISDNPKLEAEGKVENAAGTKCPRCWKHSLTPNAEGLCPRCAEVVRHLPDLL